MAENRRFQNCSKHTMDVLKLVRTVIVVGVVQLAVIAHAFFSYGFSMPAAVFVLGISAVVSVILSIQATTSLFRANQQLESYCGSVTNLEELNNTLREQRHDFKNHIQVISALLEMDEVEEAKKYVGRLSQDLRSVGRAIRTNFPAVNALLQAKANICDAKGIRFEMDVATRLESLPMEQWELCRVLGNLIDNAIEAQETEKVEGPFIRVSMTEADGAVMISVFNNGTAVPNELQERIFLPGVSTKGPDRGTGLAIVKRIVAECGGSVLLDAEGGGVCFTLRLPYSRDYESASDISNA